MCPCRPGYDGSNRINDFHEFDFNRKQWGVVPALGAAPSPRDRHVAVIYRDSFYVFAGFDGSSRVNDFLEFNFCEARGWQRSRAASALTGLLLSRSDAEMEPRRGERRPAAKSQAQPRRCRLR